MEYNIILEKNRFYQSFSINFLFEIAEEEEENIFLMIPKLLLRGTKSYQTIMEIYRCLYDCYDAKIGAAGQFINNVGLFKISSNVINKNLLPGKEDVHLKVLDIQMDLINNSKLLNGEITEKELAKVKKKLKKHIVKEKEDYMNEISRIVNMEKETSLEQIDEITIEQVMKLYKKIISSSKVIVKYKGEEYPEQLKKITDENIRGVESLDITPKFRTNYTGEKYIEKIINKENSIAAVILEPKKYNAKDIPQYKMYAFLLNVYMFNQIREKQSLAYDAGARYAMYDNIFILKASIDKKDKKETFRSIDEILRKIENGDIDEKYLEEAKADFIWNIESENEEKKGSNILEEIFSLEKNSMTIQDVQKITVQDMKKIAQNIKFDFKYYLGGN